MTMFRIECFVRLSKLGEVMDFLDGKVANLELRHVRMKEAPLPKDAPVEKKPRQSYHRKSEVRDKVKTLIAGLAPSGREFRRHQLLALCREEKISVTAMNNTIHQLIDEGKLTKVSPGTWCRSLVADAELAA